MLYTQTPAGQQRDRIELFPLTVATLMESEGRKFIGVAVQFDARSRRLVPLRAMPQEFDPTWTTPAEPHPDGSVTARGPIPELLFLA